MACCYIRRDIKISFIHSFILQSSLLPGLCRLLLLRLLQSFQPLVTSSFSWSIWTLYRLRQLSRSKLGPTIKDTVLAQVQRCMLHGCPSQEPNYGRSAAELEEAIVECAGWLCTLGCKSGCSTTRKRASNPGTVQDTCTPRHWKDEKVGKKPCVAGEPQIGDLEAKVQTSVKSTPRINLMPRPFRTCEKECLVF